MNESVVILTGGHTTRSGKDQTGTRKTNCLLLSQYHWLLLPKMPFARTRHGAAVCCGQLYVVGGKSPFPMCSFNPKQNRWIAHEKELATRLHCSVTALNEELYVIGGEDHLNRVDKYNPTLDEWMKVASIRTGRAAHCAVAIGNLIYVLGGCDSNVCLNSVECFDSSSDQWTDKPCMTYERKFAGVATSCGRIFVVGGFRDMGFNTLHANCEMFDPVLDQWSLVSSPIMARAACAMVSFNDHLYLFGGEDANCSKFDSVERYDVQNDKWELFGTMPEKLACVQASVLLLPKKYIL